MKESRLATLANQIMISSFLVLFGTSACYSEGAEDLRFILNFPVKNTPNRNDRQD
jgi:hypothetical protein